LVDSAAQPTVASIGVNNTYRDPSGVIFGHVAFVTSVSGSMVTTREQQCGVGFTGGWLTKTRNASWFNAGFIRAPIPEVRLQVWNGAQAVGNGATLTVTRPLFSRSVNVSFGFSLLRSNASGSSTYRWAINSVLASTAGMFTRTFTAAGTYAVVVTVTNSVGVARQANAWVVVR
jgi:hypothetical protein